MSVDNKPKSKRHPVIDRTGLLAGLLLVQLAVTGFLVPGYLSVGGLLDVTRQFSEAGIIALGMTMVIITGGIDISVGALLALTSVTIGFSFQAGLPLWLACTAGVSVATLGGFFNGLLITSLRLHPLVVTLGTFALFRGIAYAVSNAGAVSQFEPWFSFFGQTWIFGGQVPVQLLIYMGFLVVVAVLLGRTRFGRYVYAAGNNEVAAQFSGVNTDRIKLWVYTFTGFCVGIAALIYTSRLSTARGNAGYGLELTVIAMVVLGGAKITGGSGSIAGTVLGVLILSYLQDALQFAGVRSDAGLIVIGACLVLGVFLNEFFRAEER